MVKRVAREKFKNPPRRDTKTPLISIKSSTKVNKSSSSNKINKALLKTLKTSSSRAKVSRSHSKSKEPEIANKIKTESVITRSQRSNGNLKCLPEAKFKKTSAAVKLDQKKSAEKVKRSKRFTSTSVVGPSLRTMRMLRPKKLPVITRTKQNKRPKMILAVKDKVIVKDDSKKKLIKPIPSKKLAAESKKIMSSASFIEEQSKKVATKKKHHLTKNMQIARNKMKALGFWAAPPRRAASLNAAAVVQCMYNADGNALRVVKEKTSNEIELKPKGFQLRSKSKSPQTGGNVVGVKTKSDIKTKVKSKVSPKSKKDSRASYKIRFKSSQNSSSSSSEEEEEEEMEKGPITKRNNFQNNKKRSKKSLKDEFKMEIRDMIVKKRLASLNATAIMSATYHHDKVSQKKSKNDNFAVALPCSISPSTSVEKVSTFTVLPPSGASRKKGQPIIVEINDEKIKSQLIASVMNRSKKKGKKRKPLFKSDNVDDTTDSEGGEDVEKMTTPSATDVLPVAAMKAEVKKVDVIMEGASAQCLTLSNMYRVVHSYETISTTTKVNALGAQQLPQTTCELGEDDKQALPSADFHSASTCNKYSPLGALTSLQPGTKKNSNSPAIVSHHQQQRSLSSQNPFLHFSNQANFYQPAGPLIQPVTPPPQHSSICTPVIHQSSTSVISQSSFTVPPTATVQPTIISSVPRQLEFGASVKSPTTSILPLDSCHLPTIYGSSNMPSLPFQTYSQPVGYHPSNPFFPTGFVQQGNSIFGVAAPVPDGYTYSGTPAYPATQNFRFPGAGGFFQPTTTPMVPQTSRYIFAPNVVYPFNPATSLAATQSAPISAAQISGTSQSVIPQQNYFYGCPPNGYNPYQPPRLITPLMALAPPSQPVAQFQAPFSPMTSVAISTSTSLQQPNTFSTSITASKNGRAGLPLVGKGPESQKRHINHNIKASGKVGTDDKSFTGLNSKIRKIGLTSSPVVGTVSPSFSKRETFKPSVDSASSLREYRRPKDVNSLGNNHLNVKCQTNKSISSNNKSIRGVHENHEVDQLSKYGAVSGASSALHLLATVAQQRRGTSSFLTSSNNSLEGRTSYQLPKGLTITEINLGNGTKRVPKSTQSSSTSNSSTSKHNTYSHPGLPSGLVHMASTTMQRKVPATTSSINKGTTIVTAKDLKSQVALSKMGLVPGPTSEQGMIYESFDCPPSLRDERGVAPGGNCKIYLKPPRLIQEQPTPVGAKKLKQLSSEQPIKAPSIMAKSGSDDIYKHHMINKMPNITVNRISTSPRPPLMPSLSSTPRSSDSHILQTNKEPTNVTKKKQSPTQPSVNIPRNIIPWCRRNKGPPKFSNGWSWIGRGTAKNVFLNNDDAPVMRICYESMQHREGDIVKLRDCILLASGNRKKDLPFIAKVVSLWENLKDGEMMMTLLWFYRPEHVDTGRKPEDLKDEVFASKHLDSSSVACIEDKCYVMTFNEYCRYNKFLRMVEQRVCPSPSVVPELASGYNHRADFLPTCRVAPDRVFLCTRVYESRQKRFLKNPY